MPARQGVLTLLSGKSQILPQPLILPMSPLKLLSEAMRISLIWDLVEVTLEAADGRRDVNFFTLCPVCRCILQASRIDYPSMR